MIYGNVNVDMNPDVLGVRGRHIPTHVRRGDARTHDGQALLAKAEHDLRRTSALPATYQRDQMPNRKSCIRKNYHGSLDREKQVRAYPDDYFKFVFATRTTGNMTTISVYRSGKSPLIAKKNADDERRQSSNLLLNILSAVSTLDENALAAEYDYYSILSRIIREQSWCITNLGGKRKWKRKRLSFLRLRLTVTTLSAQSAVGFIPDRCVYWGMWRMAHPANSAALMLERIQ